ncbi:hypothetical protein PG990_003846 [Apiospora arundinis]
MDPLLTSLCGICHVREPKYKCPRCGANTCSLPCVKKHKKWSSCNGQRDATVYMPPSKLRTDAGIDHDYNFLTKIERSLEQTEKLLVHERRILPEREQQNDRSNGPPNKKTRLNKGQSRGRTTLEGGTRSWARPALKKLNALGITVKNQPYGMSRHKSNTTSFNKRSQTINWQVEWCFLDPASSPQPEKLLNKTLDKETICLGYSDCREYYRRLQMSKKEKESEKQEKKENEEATAGAGEVDEGDNNAIFSGQDWESTTWAATSMVNQGLNGHWETRENLLPSVKGAPSMRKTNTSSTTTSRGRLRANPQKLIPVNADDSLASVLSGMEVLEFPSIYVTPAGTKLPPGYRLAKRPTSSTSQGDSRLPQKRKAGGGLVEYDDSSEEEGEVGEENDDEVMVVEQEAADTTSSSGSDSEDSEEDSDEEME